MPDVPGHAATSHDSRYSLTIEDAAELYARAGHPRTLRTIQRYAASGHLDAIKVATTLGDKYFIDPTSLDRHLAQIEEMARLDLRPTDRDASRQAAALVAQGLVDDKVRHDLATDADPPPPVVPPVRDNSAATLDDASRQVAADTDQVSRYVALLEREVEQGKDEREFLREQIDRKDKTIDALIERDRETNFLVRGLQEMLTPLLGGPRREPRGPEDRPLD